MNSNEIQSPPAEQRRTEEGLWDTGELRSDERIVGFPDVTVFTAETQTERMWNTLGHACKFACDKAVAAGAACCSADTTGLALVACLAVADDARDTSRN